MTDLPPIDPKDGFHVTFEIELPPERLWRFSCWLKRVTMCSWRGHERWVSPFVMYCARCRKRLPPVDGGEQWTAHWIEPE